MTVFPAGIGYYLNLASRNRLNEPSATGYGRSFTGFCRSHRGHHHFSDIIAKRVKNVCLLNHSVLSGRLSSHMIAITTVYFADNFVCHDPWIDHLRRTKALSAPPADILYLFGKKLQPNRRQCRFKVSWVQIPSFMDVRKEPV